MSEMTIHTTDTLLRECRNCGHSDHGDRVCLVRWMGQTCDCGEEILSEATQTRVIRLEGFGPLTDYDAAHVVSEENPSVLAIVPEPDARTHRSSWTPDWPEELEERFRRAVRIEVRRRYGRDTGFWLVWDPGRDQVEEERI